MYKYKFFLLIFMFIFVLPLNGCMPQKQLHDRLIIQGIGIDLENSRYKLAVDCFDSNSSSDEKGAKSEIIKSEGNSVCDALFNLSSKVSESPLYSQNFVLLIGEDVAKDGISNVIDFFVRHYETRPNVNIFTVQGKANEIMSSKKNNEPITCESIENIAKGDFYNAKKLKSNILGVVSSIKNKTSDFKTLSLKSEDSCIKASGLAIFKDDKLKGFLDSDETFGAMLFGSKVCQGTKTLNIENIGEITFTITDSNSCIDIKKNDLNIFCDIKTQVKASIYEANRKEVNSNLPLRDSFDILKKELSKILETSIWKAINKIIWEYKSDVFDLGKRYLKENPEDFTKISNDWSKIIENIKYNVKVVSDLEKTGQEI